MTQAEDDDALWALLTSDATPSPDPDSDDERLWQALTGGPTARTAADLTDDDRLLEQLFGPQNPTQQGENQ